MASIIDRHLRAEGVIDAAHRAARTATAEISAIADPAVRERERSALWGRIESLAPLVLGTGV